MLEASLVDASAVETDGFFFKRLGEIIFSPTSDQSFPTRCTTLAVAPHSGIICFSDAGGLYIVYTQDLLKKLTKWDEDNPQPPTPPASICKSVLSHTNATIHLSPDESQLAVIDNHNNTVSFYSLPSLIHGNPIKACISSHTLPTHTTQLAWSPVSMGTYALLTHDGQVYIGYTNTEGRGEGKAGLSVYTDIEAATCIAFNPNSNSENDVILAVGHNDVVSFYKIEEDNNNKTREAVSQIKLSSQEVQEDNQHLAIESMQWLDGSHILIGCALLFDGNVEPVAPEGVLSWNPGKTIPSSSEDDDIKYVEFFASNIVPPTSDNQNNINSTSSSSSATAAAPYLQSTSLPQWSCVVYSNRQAADDHIKVAKYHHNDNTSDNDVVAVDITDDRLAIRIPNAPDDEDNYVIGLGIDCTSVEWPVVEHPTDQTAPDLPPQPVLFVATSDGVLRAYTFGCVDGKDGGDGCVGARKELRMLEEEEEEEEVEDKAAKTGLPSDSEEFSEEEEEEEKEVPPDPPSVSFAPPAATIKPQALPPQQPIFSFTAPPLPPPATQAQVEPKQEIKPQTTPIKTTTEDKIKLPPSPTLPTRVDLPLSKLRATRDSKEAVEIEADFLKTLHTTRKLEAEVHDALVATLNGPGTDMGTRATHHSGVLSQLSFLNSIDAALFSTNDLRGRVMKLVTDIKDALRRCEAMPLFQSAASISGLEEEREQHRELTLKQPLNASLSGLKDAIRCELVAYKAKVTELSSCLESLEAHQHQRKQQMMTQGGSTLQQQQPSGQALYTSVNALGAAVQSTLHHLTALSEKLVISDNIDGDNVGDRLSVPLRTMGLHSNERKKLSPSPSPPPPQQQQQPQQLSSALQSLSVTDSGRRNWQLVRKSPMSRDNINVDHQHLRPSVSPMHQTRAATSPLRDGDGGGRDGDVWEGGEGDALRRRILEACQPLGLMLPYSTNANISVNGVRVTSVASKSRGSGRGGGGTGIGGGWSSRRLWVEKLGGGDKAVEPVELPVPNTRTTTAAVERNEEVKSSRTAQMTTSNVAAMQAPPVPTSKPKTQKPPQAQPPIPSMAQVKAASKLMEKAGGAAAPKPPSTVAAAPSPPIPSNAAAQAAQARFDAFQKDVSPTEKKSGEASQEKKESTQQPQQPLFSSALPSPTSGGFNFSGLGLGGTGTVNASKPSSGFGFALAPSSSSSSTTTTKQGVFASAAPVFGTSSAAAFGANASTFGSSAPVFGASSASVFGAPTTSSTGSPFGQGASPVSSFSSPFGSGTTFGSSQPASSPAFGSATGFGAPSTFGSSQPASSPAFGSATGFGAPSAFGSSQPASSPAFGSATGFGAPSAFGSSQPASSPAFGSSTPFGQGSTTPVLGATTPFGQQQQQTGSEFGSGGGGFGQAAPSSSAFGGGSSPFGQAAAPGGGGFGAFGGGSNGGGGGFGGIKPAAGTASSTGAGNASLWQPRK